MHTVYTDAASTCCAAPPTTTISQKYLKKNSMARLIAALLVLFSAFPASADSLPANCGTISGLYIVDQATDQVAHGPVIEGEEIDVADLPSAYYLSAVITGTVESVKFFYNENEYVENNHPYTYPGGAENGNDFVDGPGSYSVGMKAFSENDAQGIICDYQTVSFMLTSTCDNVTSAGSISGPTQVCSDQNVMLQSVQLPEGGSGTMEYVWLFNPNSADWQGAQEIESNTADLIAPANGSGWYRRCARRAACTDYNGESNWVHVAVTACDPLENGWNYSCEDGIEVELYSVGLKNSVPSTLDFDSPANITQVAVEIVYKGNNPGSSIQITAADGTEYTAPRLTPIGGSSNVKVYRAMLPATSTVTYSNTSHAANAQSMVAYVFRNTGTASATTGAFTNRSGYNDLEVVTIPILSDNAPRPVYIEVPVSELTPDGRYIHLTAEAGGVTTTLADNIWDDDFESGCCVKVFDLFLNDVPGNATEVTLTIDTRNNGPHHGSVNGQSYVLAGAVNTEVGCPCEAPTVTANGLQTEVVAECGDDLPMVTFDNGALIDYEEIEGAEICRIDLSTHADYNWRNFWFHAMPEPYDKNFVWNEGYVLRHADGTAEIFGKVENNSLSGSGFFIHYYFEQLVDYSTWIAGGGYDSGDALVASRLHAGVDFSKPNTLIGYGEFADADLELISTGNVAFMDFGPRNVYGGDGVGFWIDYQGTINGMPAGTSLNPTGGNHNDMYAAVSDCSEPLTEECHQRLLRRWIVADGCGAQEAFVQTIEIRDTQAPILVFGPGDLTIDGGESIPPLQDAIFDDECDDQVDVSFDETTELQADGSTLITRSWTASDDCQNINLHEQLITVLVECTLELNGTSDPNTLCGNECIEFCYESPTRPEVVNAQVATINTADNTVTVRTTFSKTFVDNTYGDESIGWSGGHSFNQLVGSDHLVIGLTDANGDMQMEMKLDYISSDDSTPSGYGSEGVLDMEMGNSAHVISVTSSLVENFNTFGYVLTDDSPQTDEEYASDSNYPAWIYEVWYEVTVSLDAFGTAGFGSPSIEGLHASPSKTGNNSEEVEFAGCCGYACSGSIDLNIIGGKAPFEILWSNGDTVEDPTGLCAGDYSVLVTDANGCNFEADFVVTDDLVEVTADATSYAAAFCEIPEYEVLEPCDCECNGKMTSITLQYMGMDGVSISAYSEDDMDGTSIATYSDVQNGQTLTFDALGVMNNDEFKSKTYLYIDNAEETEIHTSCSQDIAGLTIGQFKVIGYTDGDGVVCSATDCLAECECDGKMRNLTLLYSGPSGASVVAADDDDDNAIIITSLTDVQSGDFIQVSAIGILDNDEFESKTYLSVNGGTPTELHTSCSEDIGGLTFGEFTVIGYTDGEGNVCGDTNPGFDCNGFIDITVTSGVAPYSFLWSNGSTNEDLTQACAGEYTVIITDANGCSTTLTESVEEETISSGELEIAAHTVCLDNGSASISASFTEPALIPEGFETLFILTQGGGLTIVQTATQAEFMVSESGEYTIHTLVYDPATIDMEIIIIGTTSALEVNAILTQGGGDICGSLDVDGAVVTVLGPTAIGDLVWLDDNDNGLLDDDESGLEGITLTLFECSLDADGQPTNSEGLEVSSTTSDENGMYGFYDCFDPSKSYYIIVSDLPEGYEFSEQNVGDDETIDSDADENGFTSCITIPENGDPDIDFGLNGLNSVGDFVWYDNDQDGIQDEDETGVENVTVQLISAGPDGLYHTADDIVVDSQDTDENGAYLFEEVPAGNYCIEFLGSTLPADYIFTTTDNTTDDNDSDADADGKTEPFDVVIADGDKLDLDAGIYLCSEITIDIDGQPEDIQIECDEAIPTSTTPGFYDEFDDDLTITFLEVESAADCGYDLTRSWTATNHCGNRATVEQVIQIRDTQDPTITFSPEDVTIGCNDPLPNLMFQFQDNCDTQLTLNMESESETMDCGDIEYTFTQTATDDCGNSVSGSVKVTRRDMDAPIIVDAPEDFTPTCDEEVPAPEQPTFEDACDDDLDIDFSEQSTTDADEVTTIIRTWTATDDCGNTVDYTQTITINPCEVSVGDYVWYDTDQDGIQDEDETGVENVTVQLISAGPDGLYHTADDIVVDSQDTDENGAYLFEEVPAGNYCIEFLGSTLPADYIFTATDNTTDDNNSDADASGKTEPFDVVIADGDKLDVDAGIYLCSEITIDIDGQPEDIQIECDETIPTSTTPGFYDEFDDDLTITFLEVESAADCGYDLTRSWTATNHCGNRATVEQVIQIRDTQDPTITFSPEDVTIGCNDPLPNLMFQFQDNCDTQLTLNMESESETMDCGDIEYTFTQTATDDCGNSVSGSVKVTRRDMDAPIIVDAPEDFTPTCDEEVPAPEQPTFEDACDDDLDIDFSEQSTTDADEVTTIIRTWTATDDCGNTVDYTQTITVNPCEVSVGDYVWYDTDQDGIQDEDETGVENVTVQLISAGPDGLYHTADDIVVDSQETDENGAYLFEEVPAGNYCIEFLGSTLPADYIFTTTDNTTDDNDSDADASGKTEPFDVVIADGDKLDLDAGIHLCSAITLTSSPADFQIECDVEIPAPIAAIFSDEFGNELDVTFSEEEIALDCGVDIVRTWTATNNCGSEASTTQTVSIRDTQDPTITFSPEDVTIGCNDPLPNLMFQFQDNCDTQLTLNMESESETMDCGDIEYTFTQTATDDCGNSVSGSVKVTRRDMDAPIIVDAPEDLTPTCDEEVPAPEQPTFEDACDDDLDIDFSEQSTTDADEVTTIIRTWTATDDCGNTVDYAQTITVNPCEVSVGDYVWYDTDQDGIQDEDETGVENVTVQLISAGPDGLYHTADDIVADSQETDENGAYLFEEVPAGNYCIEFLGSTLPADYIFTTTDNTTDDNDSDADASGKTEPFDVVIADGDKLDLDAGIHLCSAITLTSSPADFHIECDVEIPAPIAATFSDEFGNELDVTFSEEEIALDCGVDIVRTWTATNNCGNEASTTQTVSIRDTQDPVIISAPENVELSCEDDIPNLVFQFDDNCDDQLTLSMSSDNEVLNDCGDVIWTFTQTATDDCGNSATGSVTVTIRDLTAPILSGVPEDVTAQCGPTPQPASVTASDNCDEDVQVTVEEEIIENGCEKVILHTYTAIDDCGNTVSAIHTTTYNDTMAPEIIAPEDAQVDCSATDLSPNTAGFASGTDNCSDDVDTDYVDSEITGDCPASFIRTWTISDICGNASTHQQTITIVDETAPVLTAPEAITIDCSAPTDIQNTGEATATDDCHTVSISHSDGESSGDCPYSFIRTFIATDLCGNSSEATQTITIVDEESPVLLNGPADITLHCDVLDISEDEPTFSDNCDQELSVGLTETENDLDCGYEIIRTWTATDACDNATTHTQTITVIDEVAPHFTDAPADVTVECTAIPVQPTLSATDNCDEDVTITFLGQEVESGCPTIMTRTWTATDDCGNTSTHTQTITIEDTTAPELFLVPGDVTEQCGDLPTPAPVYAIDACTDETDLEMVDVVTSESCPRVIERTWTATDACGNTASATQTITFDDTVAPSISCPADISLDCADANTSPDVTGVASATDNCDSDLEVSYIDGEPTGSCPITFVRTWTATDDCGNFSICEQTISIVDETAPNLMAPDDITIQCTDIQAPIFTGQAIATDACSGLQITYTDNVPEQSCPYTIERTWTAWDGCENQETAVQIITVEDTSSPVVENAPEDVTVQCDAALPTDQATFSDNCDPDLTVAYVESTTDSDCGYTLGREWTATDVCGNSTTHTQTITVTDDTAPTFDFAPANVTVECTDIPAIALPTATDNCDTEVEVVFNGQEVEGSCPTIISRSWTATDDCGNTTEHTQVITVEDTVAPELIGTPSDIEVQCSDIPDPAILSATDACDDNLDVELSEEIDGGDCPYTITRTWSVTDICGNTSTAVQTITVIDTEAPVFEPYPSQLEVNCELADEIYVTATDNCDTEIEITYTEIYFSASCYNTIERTYIAIDDCGNESEPVVQFLFVTDESAPMFVDAPQDLTIGCGENPPPAIAPQAIDNCDDDVEVTFIETVSGQDCPYVIERVWTAEDGCGNITIHTQLITVVTNVSTNEVITNAYPNPFSNTITLTFVIPEDGFVAYEVYNNVGQVIETVFKGYAIGGIEYRMQVNADAWTTGVYSSQLIYDADVHTGRIMKE